MAWNNARLGSLLAVSSVVLFWVMPVSPLISIAALSATKSSPQTPRRRLAVAGAMLSMTAVTLAAVAFSWAVVALLVAQSNL